MLGGILTEPGKGTAVPRALVAAIFLSCYLTWRPSDDIMFTASDALFMLALFGLTLRGQVPLEPFRFLTGFWIAGFLLLVGGLLIGSIGSLDPSRWLIVSSQYLFAWIVLPLILLRRTAEQTAIMVRAFVWGVVAMNLFGAIVYFTYTGTFEEARALFGLDFLSGGRRLGAFASDANWNGAVIAMAVPAVFYLRAERHVGNAVTLIWLAVLSMGVMLCASFTAFISCVAAAAIFAVVGGARLRARTILFYSTGGALLLAALVWRGVSLPSIFVERVGNAVGSADISEAGTFEGRMMLIREAWGIVEHHMLIGVGADQYRVISAFKAPVHNMYLLLWAEGGLPSMIGWLMMMAVPLAAAIKAYHRDRLATAFTLSVMTTFLIASSASPHMYARLWSVPLLLALAASLEVAVDPGLARRRRVALRMARIDRRIAAA